MTAPHEIIEGMVRARRAHADAKILAELTALAPLPDEDDEWWETAEGRAPDAALLYVALVDLAAARKLGAAIPLLLERASYGDFGEMMRELPNSLVAIAGGDEAVVRDACLAAIANRRPGTRLWAVTTLGILRDRAALKQVRSALEDDAEMVAEAAELAVEMIGAARKPKPRTRKK